MSNRSQNKNRNNLFAQCTKFTSVWWPLMLEPIDRFTDRCLGPDHSIKSQGDALPASNKGRYWSRNLQSCVCWLAKCHNSLCWLCSEAMYLWVRRVEGEKAVGLQRFYVVLGFFTTQLIMPRTIYSGFVTSEKQQPNLASPRLHLWTFYSKEKPCHFERCKRRNMESIQLSQSTVIQLPWQSIPRRNGCLSQ